jgi:hypothetical protein
MSVDCRDEYMLDLIAQIEDDTAMIMNGRDHCIDFVVFVRGQMRRGAVSQSDGQRLLDMLLTVQNGLERGQHYAKKYRKFAGKEHA